MRYLSHCRFWWRGPAWWLANLLPFNFTTLPQKSSSVGAGRLDPRKSLQILGYVIGKSIKDKRHLLNNKRLGYIKQRFNLRMHVQIKGLNRTSPSNWEYAVISVISNEFKDGRCEAKEQRMQQKDRYISPKCSRNQFQFLLFPSRALCLPWSVPLHRKHLKPLCHPKDL